MAPVALPIAPIGPEPISAQTLWQSFAQFIVRRRVRISLVVFVALILEDVLEGIKPHDLANVYDAKSMLGLGLILAGLGLRSWAAGILRKGSQLTTTGPYSVIRNPLYVGSFMMMLGFCALIDDAENIWFILGPFVVLYVLRVLHEERSLSERFGEQWHKYVRSVPRFFPRWLPTQGFAHWNLDQWLGNREYRAVSAVLLGLVAVEMWQLF